MHQSTESMDSLKRDLSDASKTSTDESDSDDDSDTATDYEQQTTSKQQAKATKSNQDFHKKAPIDQTNDRTTFFIKSINGIVRNMKL